ncbi:MAG: hypothetical protein AABZ24_11185, partial [Nitrospirota bacterium]
MNDTGCDWEHQASNVVVTSLQTSLYLRLIQILLKPSKDSADLFRLAQVCHGVRHSIVILQFEQRGELILRE